MNDDDILTVPYVVYESGMSRQERMVKRMFIALIASIIVTLASNLAWMYMWNQYDYAGEDTTIELGTGENGNANYIGNDGEINNGTN